MISELKRGIGGAKFPHFMEWRCCGMVWQLRMWKGQMFRRDWSPECEKCNSSGESFSQILNKRR